MPFFALASSLTKAFARVGWKKNENNIPASAYFITCSDLLHTLMYLTPDISQSVCCLNCDWNLEHQFLPNCVSSLCPLHIILSAYHSLSYSSEASKIGKRKQRRPRWTRFLTGQCSLWGCISPNRALGHSKHLQFTVWWWSCDDIVHNFFKIM